MTADDPPGVNGRSGESTRNLPRGRSTSISLGVSSAVGVALVSFGIFVVLCMVVVAACNPNHVDKAALARSNRALAVVAPGISKIDLAHTTNGPRELVVECGFNDDVVTDRPGMSREWRLKDGQRPTDAVSDLSDALVTLGFRADGPEQVNTANVYGDIHTWDFAKLVRGEKVVAAISWSEGSPDELYLYVEDVTSPPCYKDYL